MDKAALMALAAVTASLQGTRLRNVEARLFSRIPTGGHLATETTVALTKSSEEWISTVVVKVEGFPKEVDRSTATPERRSFSIEVLAQAAYTWSKPPSKQTLNDPELARVLGRPTYLLAAAELQQLARKLGLVGIKLPPDVPATNDDGVVKLTSGDKKKLMQKIAVVRPAQSKGVSPKTARKIGVK